MPIYEYKCRECGEVFEVIQKFSDPELTVCRCEEKAPVKKLISAAAFHLKGTGWYVTDFRDKDKKKKDGKSTGEPAPAAASKSADGGSEAGSGSSGSESSSSAKSDSKAEAAD